jgi:AraC-like DNA-binding protein
MDAPAADVLMLDALLARLGQRRAVGGRGFLTLAGGEVQHFEDRNARCLVLVLVTDGHATIADVRLGPGDLMLLRPAAGTAPALAGDSRLRGYRWTFHLGDRRQGRVPLCLVERDCGHLAGLMALGFAECRLNDRWRNGRLAALLELMLSELRRRRHRPPQSGPRLSPAQCQAIEASATDAGPHGVDSGDLARVCGLSRRYFTRLLRATYGVSVRRWILAQRLRHGANLLVQSQRPVAEIARELGYVDSALFCRQFKTLYGVSPLRHRRQPAHAQLDLWRLQRV